jgi:exportin-T
MVNLLAQFEPSELVDFMNFIGLLIHKLQVRTELQAMDLSLTFYQQRELFNVLDELIGPLSAHITQLLSQLVVGTDDSATQTKRAYLTLLTNIMSSDLHDIFISDRKLMCNWCEFRSQTCTGNKATFEPLLNSMSGLAEDISDPSGQKSAFAFLSRCVQVWCQPAAGGQTVQGLPGFERFVYERLVPTAFVVLSSPQFNIKDGQMMVVCTIEYLSPVSYYLTSYSGATRNWQLPPDSLQN